MVNQPPERIDQTFIPSVAPVQLTEATVDDFVAWAARSDASERLSVREAIEASQGDGSVLSPLFERLQKAIEGDLGTSLIILGIIGELRNPDSLDRLDELVWRAPPPEEEVGHGALGTRDILEMLQSKAVECLAYVGTDISDELTLRVVREHPAVAVRSAAVDAYLFNHQDGEEARERLRAVVQSDDLPFIDRVRRTGAGGREAFNEGMRRFYELHPQEVAPEPGETFRTNERDQPSEPPTR